MIIMMMARRGGRALRRRDCREGLPMLPLRCKLEMYTMHCKYCSLESNGIDRGMSSKRKSCALYRPVIPCDSP